MLPKILILQNLFLISCFRIDSEVLRDSLTQDKNLLTSQEKNGDDCALKKYTNDEKSKNLAYSNNYRLFTAQGKSKTDSNLDETLDLVQNLLNELIKTNHSGNGNMTLKHLEDQEVPFPQMSTKPPSFVVNCSIVKLSGVIKTGAELPAIARALMNVTNTLSNTTKLGDNNRDILGSASERTLIDIEIHGRKSTPRTFGLFSESENEWSVSTTVASSASEYGGRIPDIFTPIKTPCTEKVIKNYQVSLNDPLSNSTKTADGAVILKGNNLHLPKPVQNDDSQTFMLDENTNPPIVAFFTLPSIENSYSSNRPSFSNGERNSTNNFVLDGDDDLGKDSLDDGISALFSFQTETPSLGTTRDDGLTESPFLNDEISPKTSLFSNESTSLGDSRAEQTDNGVILESRSRYYTTHPVTSRSFISSEAASCKDNPAERSVDDHMVDMPLSPKESAIVTKSYISTETSFTDNPVESIGDGGMIDSLMHNYRSPPVTSRSFISTEAALFSDNLAGKTFSDQTTDFTLNYDNIPSITLESHESTDAASLNPAVQTNEDRKTESTMSMTTSRNYVISIKLKHTIE